MKIEIKRIKKIKLRGLSGFLTLYLAILLCYGIVQALPKNLDNTTYEMPPDRNYTLAYVEVFEGQQIKIKILVQGGPLLVEIKISQTYFEEVVSDEKTFIFTAKETGEVRVTGISSSLAIVETTISRQGFSTSLRLFLILGCVILSLSYSLAWYFKRRRLRTKDHDNDLIEGKKTNLWKQILVIYSMEKSSYNIIGLTLAIVFFSYLNGVPSSFNYVKTVTGRPNLTDYEIDVWVLSTKFAYSIYSYMGLSISLLLFTRINEEKNPSMWHEKSYPISQTLRSVVRLFSLSIFILLIPLIDFTVSIFLTLNNNETSLDTDAIILAYILSFLFVMIGLGCYFIIYELTSNKGIRLLTPLIFIFMASSDIGLMSNIPILSFVDNITFPGLKNDRYIAPSSLISTSLMYVALIFILITIIDYLKPKIKMLNN
jgi:hypothetical protein